MDRNQRLIHIQNKKKKKQRNSWNRFLQHFNKCVWNWNQENMRLLQDNEWKRIQNLLTLLRTNDQGQHVFYCRYEHFFSCIFHLRKIVQSHRIQILCSGACHNATFQYIRLECSDAKTKRQKERGRKKRQCGTEREENRTERKKRQNWKETELGKKRAGKRRSQKKTELKKNRTKRKKRHAHRILVPND